MTVTLDLKLSTSQQTFDSYVGNFAGLALDLINELAVERASGRPIQPPASAAAQLAAIGRALSRHDDIHTAPFGVDGAAALTRAVRRLRSAVDACVDGDIPGAATVLNEMLRRHHAVPNLHGRPTQPLVLAFHAVGQDPVNSYLADMTTSIAMIIGTGRTARLRRCHAQECDRVFYDTTRNGSRRFCELACQNRAKASAYRARQVAVG